MSYDLNTILKKIEGRFICVYQGASKEFLSAYEFEQSDISKGYTVSTIRAEGDIIILNLKKLETPVADLDGEWVKEHEEQFGEKPSFF